MSKKAKPDDSGSCLYVRGRLFVGAACLGIATRMVVGDCEGATIVTQHGVEDLANGYE